LERGQVVAGQDAPTFWGAQGGVHRPNTPRLAFVCEGVEEVEVVGGGGPRVSERGGGCLDASPARICEQRRWW
jgi:hypothetical protein